MAQACWIIDRETCGQVEPAVPLPRLGASPTLARIGKGRDRQRCAVPQRYIVRQGQRLVQQVVPISLVHCNARRPLGFRQMEPWWSDEC